MPLNGLEFLKLTFVDIDSGTILKSRNTSTRSSTDRAFDFGSKGWGFKSLRVRQTKTTEFVYPNARIGRMARALFLFELNAPPPTICLNCAFSVGTSVEDQYQVSAKPEIDDRRV